MKNKKKKIIKHLKSTYKAAVKLENKMVDFENKYNEKTCSQEFITKMQNNTKAQGIIQKIEDKIKTFLN